MRSYVRYSAHSSERFVFIQGELTIERARRFNNRNRNFVIIIDKLDAANFVHLPLNDAAFNGREGLIVRW